MARNNPKTPDSAIELPDPYGHGFERIEDPLRKLEYNGTIWKQEGNYSVTLQEIGC